MLSSVAAGMHRNGESLKSRRSVVVVGTDVPGFPASVAQVSTETLQLIICRSGTDYAGYRVTEFAVDDTLAGPAGNNFAGSLVGVRVRVERARHDDEDDDNSTATTARRDLALALKFPPKDVTQRRMVCEWFAFFPREAEIYSVSIDALIPPLFSLT